MAGGTPEFLDEQRAFLTFAQGMFRVQTGHDRFRERLIRTGDEYDGANSDQGAFGEFQLIPHPNSVSTVFLASSGKVGF